MAELWLSIMFIVLFILYLDYKILKNQGLWNEYKKELIDRCKATITVIKIIREMKKATK